MHSPFIPFAAVATVLVLLLVNAPTYAVDTTRAPATMCPSAEPSTSDLKATAEKTGQLNIFLAAVEAAGLSEVLETTGPYTLFAPSDEAFAKLPPGTVDALLKDLHSLRAILMYHLVAGEVSMSQALYLRTAARSTVKRSPSRRPRARFSWTAVRS